MKLDINYVMQFAEKLLKIESPTGYAQDAIAFVKKEAESLGYSGTLSAKGNLLVEVAGKDNKAMGICAHCDTLGLMVRSIKAQGTLAFTKLGGMQLPTLDGEYCTVITRDNKRYSGTVLSNSPAAHVYKDAATDVRTEETMEIRLDEKVKNKEDVIQLGIGNGDIVAIDPKTIITDSGFIKSRFLDDKISVAIIMGILKGLAEEQILLPHKTYFMFSTYEETGHGLAWIPDDIDTLLAVDMGCIGLDLACTEYDVSICAKDSGGPYDYGMTSRLIDLAKKDALSYAVDIYPSYSSDVTAALRAGKNIKGALIGPGVHASHGMERTHQEGIENTMKLLRSFILTA